MRTPRRAALSMLVVVVVSIVTVANAPGFSAGTIFGLVIALILD